MNQSALVTGSASRIGKALALTLAQMGYDIFLHYNTSKRRAEDTAHLIEVTGRDCTLKQAEFHDEAQINELLADCAEKGNLEILINNASNFVDSDFTTEGAQLLDDLYKTNFKAPYLLTKQFARQCKEGLIINMLDTKVEQNQTQQLDYLLTKKILEEFTYISAQQLAPDIRVNGIAPGLILAPEGEGEDYLEQLAKDIPLQKTGAKEQLTETLQFLVNNTFITGEVIFVDGGEHLSH